MKFGTVAQQIGVKYDKNCGFGVKSTQFGTHIEQSMLNHIWYGPPLQFLIFIIFQGVCFTVLNLPSQLPDFINKILFQVRAERKEFLKTHIQ